MEEPFLILEEPAMIEKEEQSFNEEGVEGETIIGNEDIERDNKNGKVDTTNEEVTVIDNSNMSPNLITDQMKNNESKPTVGLDEYDEEGWDDEEEADWSCIDGENYNSS